MSGLNVMQLKIQACYQSTVYTFEREVERQTKDLDAWVRSKTVAPTAPVPATQSRSTRKQARPAASTVGAASGAHFFTPFTPASSVSRTGEGAEQAFALPDVTPLNSRTVRAKARSQQSDAELQRSSISSSARTKRAVAAADDERPAPRRSMRLSALKEPDTPLGRTPLGELSDNAAARRSLRGTAGALAAADPDAVIQTPPRVKARRQDKLREEAARESHEHVVREAAERKAAEEAALKVLREEAAERERLEREKQELAEQKREAERIAKAEAKERKRLEKEKKKLEQQKLEAEKAAHEAALKLEAERVEMERVKREADRLRREALKQQRDEAERIKREAAEKIEAERRAKEDAERERKEQKERKAKEKREQAARERREAEQREAAAKLEQERREEAERVKREAKEKRDRERAAKAQAEEAQRTKRAAAEEAEREKMARHVEERRAKDAAIAKLEAKARIKNAAAAAAAATAPAVSAPPSQRKRSRSNAPAKPDAEGRRRSTRLQAATVDEPEEPTFKAPVAPQPVKRSRVSRKPEPEPAVPDPTPVAPALPSVAHLVSRFQAEPLGADEMRALTQAALHAVPKSSLNNRRRVAGGKPNAAWSLRRLPSEHTSLRDMLAAHGVVRGPSLDASIARDAKDLAEGDSILCRTVNGELGEECAASVDVAVAQAEAAKRSELEELEKQRRALREQQEALQRRADELARAEAEKQANKLPAVAEVDDCNDEDDDDDGDSGVSDSASEAGGPAMVAVTPVNFGVAPALAAASPSTPAAVAATLLTPVAPPGAVVRSAQSDQEDEDDGEDADDEEEDGARGAASSSGSPALAVTPLAQAAAISTLQGKIAELKKKFGNTAAGDEDDAVNVSLALKGNSAASAASVFGAAMRVVNESQSEDDEANNFSIAPGLFTQEITTPDRAMLAEQHQEKRAATSASPKAVPLVQLSVLETSAVPVGTASGPALFDASFMGDTNDMYNTLDAERALNAVQFLEQIELGNTTALHDITLALDDCDVGQQAVGSASTGRVSPVVTATNKSASSEPQHVSPGALAASGVATSAAAATVATAPIATTTTTTKPPMVKTAKQKQLQLPPAAGKGSPDAEPTAPSGAAVQRMSSASTIIKPAKGAGAGVMDKLALAKDRREKLEEDERKKREEVLRKAAEREQRAKALKEGKAVVPLVAPSAPVGANAGAGTGGVPTNAAVVQPTSAAMQDKNKAAILEKSKKNAERLLRDKADEARRKKAATAAPVAAAAPLPSALPAPVVAPRVSGGGEPLAKKANTGTLRSGLTKLLKKPLMPTTPSTPVAAAAPGSIAAAAAPSPRPSPVRVKLMERMASPVSEVSTTQYSISPLKPSDVEGDSDDEPVRMPKALKREAKWAKREALMRTLADQVHVNPDDVFGVHVGLTCSLPDVFQNYNGRKKKKYEARGSSAQWSDAAGKFGPK